MRVLIVEDDPAAAKLMETILSEFAECHCAADGEEAIQKFSAAIDSDRPFDLIMLDLMMPKRDGHEALVSFREIEQQHGLVQSDGTKVIIVTALDDPQSLYLALAAGCVEYLRKPFDRKKLLKTIRKLGLLDGEASAHRAR